MNPQSLDYRGALDLFMEAVNGDVMKYANGSTKLNLPLISKDLVIRLCQDVKDLFNREPVMLEVKSPCVVVGDIHGHVLDLYRILQTFGMPGRKRYIFLGDLVDRGEFSVETIIIVFLLKVIWPGNVFVIRGNHEFEFLCSQCGFITQLQEAYDDFTLEHYFLEAFSYLPLSARVDQQILCVHGGIGPSMFSLTQLRSFDRPLKDFGDDNIDSLVWSDPTDDISSFEPSSRGTGYIFGEAALNEFIEAADISLLVRGHECVLSGCEFKFKNKLVTVFSASNYCGLISNEAGVLNIISATNYAVQTFPPIPYLTRQSVFLPKMQEKPAESRKLRKNIQQASSAKQLPQVYTRSIPPSHRPMLPSQQQPSSTSLSVSKRISVTQSARELPQLGRYNEAPPPRLTSSCRPVATPRRRDALRGHDPIVCPVQRRKSLF